MIVEFLGNSGAGKSTLVSALIRLWRDDGVTVMSVTDAIHHYMRQTVVGRAVCSLAPDAWQGPILWRVFARTVARWHTAAFIAGHRELARYVWASQRRRPIPRRHRRLILRLFFNMAGQHHFFQAHRRPGEVIVFDEGFVHRAVHLFVSPAEQPDPGRIVAYLERIPRPDLLVLVQAPPDVCLARISARGLQVRLRGLDAEATARFVAHAGQVVDVAARYLVADGVEVVAVENIGDIETSVARLRRFLSNYPLSRNLDPGKFIQDADER